MGITVVSVAATNTASTIGSNASNASLGPALAAEGIFVDFAALLSGQLAGLAETASKPVATTTTKEDSVTGDELIRDLLSNPGLTPQDVIANIQPRLENRPQIEVDRNNQTLAGIQPEIAAITALPKDAPNAINTTEFAVDTTEQQQNPAFVIANIAPELANKPETGIKQNIQATSITQENRLPALGRTTIDQNQPNLPGKVSAAAESLSTTATSQNQPPPPSTTAPTQTASNLAANLAAESSSGNTAPTPSTFASVIASHSAQGQQAQSPASTGNPTITTPLQDHRWAQDFSERIVWVAKNDQQTAQINISPAQLGPVQITLNMNGDQASIAFASPHAEVRKAIEDAMPNLREMLSSAGLSLGQSNVGAQLQQQRPDGSPQFANRNRSQGETAILPADSRSGSVSTGLPIQRGRGLVDLFA